jgi:IS5 family transposase
VNALFGAFDSRLNTQRWLAMSGQMINVSTVPVRKQPNDRDRTTAVKAGEMLEGLANRRQKDTDARWTQKHGMLQYGYKNHVNVDRRHKLIRRYKVKDVAAHDSQVFDEVLHDDYAAAHVWADSAYRSVRIEERLDNRWLKSRIQRKAHRNGPLSKRGQQGNRTRSTVGGRVEHAFGAQTNDMVGMLPRRIAIANAQTRTGLNNLAYKMSRTVHLDKRTARVAASARRWHARCVRATGERSKLTEPLPSRAPARALLAYWQVFLTQTGSLNRISIGALTPNQTALHRLSRRALLMIRCKSSRNIYGHTKMCHCLLRTSRPSP